MNDFLVLILISVNSVFVKGKKEKKGKKKKIMVIDINLVSGYYTSYLYC